MGNLSINKSTMKVQEHQGYVLKGDSGQLTDSYYPPIELINPSARSSMKRQKKTKALSTMKTT